MYALQPKADHQETKFPCTDFRMIGSYIVKKALPINYCLEWTFETNKIQVLHRMRLQLFTPGQPIPDVQTTSQEWKLDPEVIIKRDDLYAKARESEYETPIFDNGRHKPDNDNSPENRGRHDLANVETCTIPGTKREGSPEIFPAQMKYVTELIRITIWSLMRKHIRHSWALLM